MTVSLGSLTLDEGTEATYTVVLDTQPTGDVTVTPASSDAGAATVSGDLTFTADNWSAAQIVTVTAVEESDATDETLSISHAVSGYGSVTSAADVQVTVTDDDVPADGIYGSLPNFIRAHAANGDIAEAEGPAGEGQVAGGWAILRDGTLLGRVALPGREVVLPDGSSFHQRPYRYILPPDFTVDGNRLSASGLQPGANDSGSLSTVVATKTVSGTVSAGEALDLVLTDEDGFENRLSLGYGAHYDRSPSLSQWEGTWSISVGGVSVATLTSNAEGVFFGQFAFNGCVLAGSLSPSGNGRNLYDLRIALESCAVEGEGDDAESQDGNYTGFAFLDDADNYIGLDAGGGELLDVPDGGENNVAVLFALRDGDSAIFDYPFTR